MPPLNYNQNQRLVSISFHRVIGALQYLSLTRPTISFPVKKLARCTHKQTQLHWITAKRVLHYQKGTLDRGILLKRIDDHTLQGFSDVDLVGDKDTRSFTFAPFLFF